MGAEIFRTCPDRPWGPPSLLYNGYLFFPGGKKRPGRDPDPLPPMGRTACTEPQCLYMGALHFLPWIRRWVNPRSSTSSGGSKNVLISVGNNPLTLSFHLPFGTVLLYTPLLYPHKSTNCWCGLNACCKRAGLFSGPFVLICTARLLYPTP